VNDPGEDLTPPQNQDTQSETSLVVAGTTVLASYNDSHLYNGGSSLHFTGYSKSTDRGSSFQDLLGLPNIGGGDCGDPVLARDNVTGRTYFAALSCNNPNIPLFRSDDDFASFLPGAVNATPGHTGLMDKEWMTVDNFDGPGQGNVYVVVRDFGSGNGIYLSRSTDQGATFGPSGGVQIVTGSSVQGAWVAVGPDHAVYSFWYETGFIRMRKSTDQGQTFGSTVTVTTLRTTGTNGDLGLGGFRSNAFPQAVVNPANGQIYVVYDDKGTGSDRADVFFRQSNDGGATWSAAVRVVDDTLGRDQWQPALAVTPNGTKVGVFWYDRRLDPANTLIDRFGAIGVVAGDTVAFGPNFRISDTSFPTAFGRDPVVNGVYMGDYDQAVADTSSFYLTWGDNRLPSPGHGGIPYADVRFARIPVEVAGPSVIRINPRGTTFPPVSTMRVTFDEEIDPTTATPDQFSLTDSSGNPINVTDVEPVKGSNNQFDVTFDTQTIAGAYQVAIGPFIADTSGHYMDQDGDGIPGEKTDVFNGSFTILAPAVVATTLSGRLDQAVVDHGRFVFNTAIDPNSFTPDQFNLQDPNGNPVNVTDIRPVDETDLQFDVTFDPQTSLGTYNLVVGPNITDFFGNPMTAAFTTQFTIISERIVNGGFETGTFSSWNLSGNTQSTFVAADHPHSGRFAADLGPFGSEGFISQTFSTTPGASYTLDYWLANGAGPPNQFEAYINGVVFPGSQLINANAFPYTEFTFTFVATGSSTELKFGFRQDPDYFFLDDVSVSPTAGQFTSRHGRLAESASLLSAPSPAAVGARPKPAAPINPVSTPPALPGNVSAVATTPTLAPTTSPSAMALARGKRLDLVDSIFSGEVPGSNW
jgi:hypothetical protein